MGAARQILTPFDSGQAEKVGKRRFRKQLLPVGSIDYKGRRLDFTRDYLRQLKDATENGPFDQIPFVLADEANRHTDDPERYRGEAAQFELADDGLYVVVDLSEEGAKLVESNPKLGISARIIEGLEEGGRRFGDVIQHVCGTLEPVVKGMKPWEAVALSADSEGAVVVDLTEATFSAPAMADLSEEQIEKLQALAERLPEKGSDGEFQLSDEDEAALKALLAAAGEEENGDGNGDGERAGAGEGEGEGEGAGEGEGTEERQPAAALSAEQRRSIELAQSEAREAKSEAARIRAEAAEERYRRERESLISKGIPPAMVDLAEPVLKRGSAVIELSGGESVDAQKVVRELLDYAEGVIDLTEIGRTQGDSSERDEARQLAKSWAEAS